MTAIWSSLCAGVAGSRQECGSPTHADADGERERERRRFGRRRYAHSSSAASVSRPGLVLREKSRCVCNASEPLAGQSAPRPLSSCSSSYHRSDRDSRPHPPTRTHGSRLQPSLLRASDHATHLRQVGAERRVALYRVCASISSGEDVSVSVSRLPKTLALRRWRAQKLISRRPETGRVGRLDGPRPHCGADRQDQPLVRRHPTKH